MGQLIYVMGRLYVVSAPLIPPTEGGRKGGGAGGKAGREASDCLGMWVVNGGTFSRCTLIDNVQRGCVRLSES